MQRRALFSAPHGFDVNDSIVFIFCFSFLCRICSSPPAHMGTRQAGWSLTAAHWLPRGLTDYNPRSATRSDVPGNRRVIIPHSMVKRKRGRFISFSGKMHRSAQAGPLPPQGGQQCGRLHVLALFPVSLVWAGTYLPCWYAVVKLQVKGILMASHFIANSRRRF